MRPSDVAELVLLAALWGASFLFMRLGAADFGPAALVFLRVAGAALLLVPLALAHGHGAALRRHARPIAAVGLINSAVPFALFMVAALTLPAGLMSILNATSPLWGALVAWAWMGDRPAGPRLAGLAVGFAGVAIVGARNAGLPPGAHGIGAGLAIGACLLAALAYGVGANVTKRHLGGVPPLAVAAGSQVAAALAALPFAALAWPARTPGPLAWTGAAALAFACTGFAYLLYFRLIANVGATNAIAVTFLIPLFGVVWGAVFLHERVGLATLAGCAVVLLGTALATGVLRGRRG